MVELLPRDSAPLSPEAGLVLQALYAEFDRTSTPVEDLTLALALTGKLKRVSTSLSQLLNSQELSPYVRRDGGKFYPTLRAALRLRKEDDLAAAEHLYALCRRLMLQRVQQIKHSELPAPLLAKVPRLALLLQHPGFASIQMNAMYPSMPTIQILQRVLDAESLGEYLAQQEDFGAASLEPVKYPAGASTRIDAIEINGFRSFSTAAVNGLGALTAFAGPNEAGKTNFFNALRFLSTTASQGIHSALERERGLGQLLRRDEKTEHLLLRALLSAGETEKYFYSVRVGRSTQVVEGLSRFEGRASLDPSRDFVAPNTVQLTLQHGPTTQVWAAGTAASEHPVLADGQSLLASLSDLSKFEPAIRVRESMRSWAFYSLESSALRADVTGANGHLHGDGSNLPAAINALGQHHPKRFQELAEAFVDLLPEARKFAAEVGLTGGARLLLYERGLTDPLSQVDYSDGMLRILALLYLAFSPEKPSLVCIEEPENGLYPRLIEAMLEALRMLSKSTQVFLTTHSVTLLDRLRPEEVVLVHRDELGTRLQRLDTREDVRTFAARLGLGAQLLSGNLENLA
jgi:predicted ATPase